MNIDSSRIAEQNFTRLTRLVKVSVGVGLISLVAGACILGLSYRSLPNGLNALSTTGIILGVSGICVTSIGIGVRLLAARPPQKLDLKEEFKKKGLTFHPDYIFSSQENLYQQLLYKLPQETFSSNYKHICIALMKPHTTTNFFGNDGKLSHVRDQMNENENGTYDFSKSLVIFVVDKITAKRAKAQGWDFWKKTYLTSQNFIQEIFEKNGGKILFVTEKDFTADYLYSHIVNSNPSD